MPCLFLQACTRKTRLLDVVYNASNNELVKPHTVFLSLYFSSPMHHLLAFSCSSFRLLFASGCTAEWSSVIEGHSIQIYFGCVA